MDLVRRNHARHGRLLQRHRRPAAISNSNYLTNQLLFANLDTWGWFFVIWGALQVIAGIAVFGGATWAASSA